MVQLAREMERFEALGVTLWAISPQTPAANAALQERRSLPFPVLADADQGVIRTWGLFNAVDPQGRDIPFPAAYLLDNRGVVRWRHVSRSTRDRPTTGEILAMATAVAQEESE